MDRRGDRVWPIEGRHGAAARSPSPEHDSARDASGRDARCERIAARRMDSRGTCDGPADSGIRAGSTNTGRPALATDRECRWCGRASVDRHRLQPEAAQDATTGRIESGRQAHNQAGAQGRTTRFRDPDWRVEVRRIDTLESSCSVVTGTGETTGWSRWRRNEHPDPESNTA